MKKKLETFFKMKISDCKKKTFGIFFEHATFWIFRYSSFFASQNSTINTKWKFLANFRKFFKTFEHHFLTGVFEWKFRQNKISPEMRRSAEIQNCYPFLFMTTRWQYKITLKTKRRNLARENEPRIIPSLLAKLQKQIVIKITV